MACIVYSISPKGGSDYRLNGKAVSWEDYDLALQEINLLVKARNFLVFQGDVESVSTKTPKQLSELFEQISASDEVRNEYEEAKKAKDRAVEKHQFAQAKKRVSDFTLGLEYQSCLARPHLPTFNYAPCGVLLWIPVRVSLRKRSSTKSRKMRLRRTQNARLSTKILKDSTYYGSCSTPNEVCIGSTSCCSS